MKRILFFLLIGSFWSISAYAQLTTTTLSSTKDTYIDVKNSSTNYGTDSKLWVTTHEGNTPGSYVYSRSFISFDLSSIPTDAEIHSVKLRLYRDTAYAGSNSFKAVLAKQSWTETGLNSSNQPVISVFYEHYSTVYSDSTSFIDIDFLIPAKRLALAEVENFGICVQLANETLQSASGSTFHSREATNSALRPKLIVKYGTPLQISGVEIEHESAASAGDGSIKFDISGGTAPYTYSWFNGQSDVAISGVNADSLMSRSYGWYGVTVTDANGFKFKQGFVIGIDNDVVDITYDPRIEYADNVTTYSRYDDVTYDYTNISYTGGMGLIAHQYYSAGRYSSFVKFPLWLDSSFSITKADLFLDGWTHYCYPTINQLNTSHFYLVTENWNHNYVTYDNSPAIDTDVNLLMPNMPVGSDNVTKDVREFWNIWKQDNASNFGLKYAIDATSGYFLEQTYFSNSYGGNHVHLPKIDFTLDLRPTIIVQEWDENNESGSITFDISSITNTGGPYHYLLSEQELPTMLELYTFLQDSVFDGNLDSTDFFTGTVNSTNHSFEGLMNGNYYINVYDNSGSLILSEMSYLGGDANFDSQNNLTSNGIDVSANGSNAHGMLNLYANEGSNSALNYSFTDASGEQIAGWCDGGSTNVTTADLFFGFISNNGYLRLVSQGNVSLDSTLVNDSSKVLLDLRGEVYRLFVDGIERASISARPSYGVQAGLRLPASGSAKISGQNASNKAYRVTPVVYAIPNCYSESGTLTFKITKIVEGVPASLSYTITNQDGNTYTSGTGLTFTDISINNVPPGIYTISGSVGSLVFTPYIVYFGYETNWDDVVDYTNSPNSYSVERQIASSASNFSSARSENYLMSSDEGWVRFKPRVPGANGLTPNFARLTNVNPYAVYPSLNEDFFFVVKYGNGEFVFHNFNSASQLGFMSMNSYATVHYDQVNPRIQLNTTTTPISLGSLGRTFRAMSGPQNHGFHNVISSYGCVRQTIDEIGYYELRRTIDGGFAHSAEGKIKFTFDEEYNTESTDKITLNIYNNSHGLEEQIANGIAQNGTPVLNYIFDDNRCILDLDGLGLTPEQHYILEVITSKKDKLYMRFIYKY